jgi:hypothetical protein
LLFAREFRATGLLTSEQKNAGIAARPEDRSIGIEFDAASWRACRRATWIGMPLVADALLLLWGAASPAMIIYAVALPGRHDVACGAFALC